MGYFELDLINRTESNLLKNEWVASVSTLQTRYEPIIKMKNNIRIISWNVHSYMDVMNSASDDCLSDLLIHFDSEIIIFQESYKPIPIELLSDGNKLIYHNLEYGLAIIGKSTIMVNTIINEILPIHNGNEQKIAVLCSIVINNIDIDLVVTHLDVFDDSDETRCEQLNYILKNIVINPTKTIIFGDLNLVRKCDYGENYWKKLGFLPTLAWNLIQQLNWDDNLLSNLSVWSGRRVDYCLLHNASKFNKMSFFYPTLLSDHLPLISDINIGYT